MNFPGKYLGSPWTDLNLTILTYVLEPTNEKNSLAFGNIASNTIVDYMEVFVLYTVCSSTR